MTNGGDLPVYGHAQSSWQPNCQRYRNPCKYFHLSLWFQRSYGQKTQIRPCQYLKNTLSSFRSSFEPLIKESIMNRFPIGKQDDAQKLSLFPDLFPLSDSSIRLNFCIVRILNRLLNPFRLYFSTVWSLYDIDKILSKFHPLWSNN